MEGEQIPKATMVNFLKSKIKSNFSGDFTQHFLQFAKDYVDKLTEEANDVCSKNDKKTINAQHVEAALNSFGLSEQISEMKDLSVQIKEQNQQRQQFRQRIQQNIEKNLSGIGEEPFEPRLISIQGEVGNVALMGEQKLSEDENYEDQQVCQVKMDNEAEPLLDVEANESGNKVGANQDEL